MKASPRSEVDFVYFLKSSAIDKQVKPLRLANIVNLVQDGEDAAASMREANYPVITTVALDLWAP